MQTLAPQLLADEAAPAAGGTQPDPADAARRIDELGRIILAYSEVTDRLEASHVELQTRVQQLHAELSDKNRELQRRQRLAALGEMAAGMAHEIRNPLGGIKLYASLLRADVKGMPESVKIVDKIASGVDRLESVVSQVLAFSREIRIQRRECDLVEVIAQAVELTRARYPNAAIQTQMPDVLPARIDPTLIGQAVLNLLLNAAEACSESGSGTVEVRAAAADARSLRIEVADDGPGIAAGDLEKVFNPFFTTKDQGTGLGLAIVHRIIEAHDGSIAATNREPHGACFTVVLGM